jgi:hypothetical protein
MIEDPAVGGVRAAVNVEDQRIFLVRVKVGRLLDPPLNVFTIETLVVDFFGAVRFSCDQSFRSQ